MAHTIEAAKSGRASCRGCREKIGKGELRFGHEVPNNFSDGDMTFRWFHLMCGAKKQPVELEQAIGTFSDDIPNKSDLEKEIASAKKKVKPSTFPYGEHSPSGRAKCIHCDEKIAKDDIRIAVEREIDTGSFTTSGAGYLHPGCAVEYADDEGILDKVRANSLSLTAEDFEVLSRTMK